MTYVIILVISPLKKKITPFHITYKLIPKIPVIMIHSLGLKLFIINQASHR